MATAISVHLRVGLRWKQVCFPIVGATHASMELKIDRGPSQAKRVQRGGAELKRGSRPLPYRCFGKSLVWSTDRGRSSRAASSSFNNLALDVADPFQ